MESKFKKQVQELLSGIKFLVDSNKLDEFLVIYVDKETGLNSAGLFSDKLLFKFLMGVFQKKPHLVPLVSAELMGSDLTDKKSMH